MTVVLIIQSLRALIEAEPVESREELKLTDELVELFMKGEICISYSPQKRALIYRALECTKK